MVDTNSQDINYFWLFFSLPRDNFLDQSKLKPFADKKQNQVETIKSVCKREENIVYKTEK